MIVAGSVCKLSLPHSQALPLFYWGSLGTGLRFSSTCELVTSCSVEDDCDNTNCIYNRLANLVPWLSPRFIKGPELGAWEQG